MIHRINSINQVRRLNSVPKAAAGILPTDIAGCKLWIDFSDATTLFTDAGSTPVSKDGDLIYQANDKSETGNYAYQTDSAKRAQYKIGIQNGLSVARSESDKYMYIGIEFKGIVGATSGSYTMFFVLDTDNVLNRQIFGYYMTSDNQCRLHHYYNGGYGINYTKVGTSYTGKQILSFHLVKGGGATLYRNGSLIGNTSFPENTNLSMYRCGFMANRIGNTPCPGDYDEFIVYNSALNDSDRQSVETYLNNKWSIY